MGIPLIGSIPTERGFHLPDVFSQPELLTPGRMPLGSVKIDWGNQLTRNLNFAWVFNSHTVANLALLPKYKALIDQTPVTGFSGAGRFFDGVSDYFTYSSVRIYPAHSVIVKFKCVDNTGDGRHNFIGHGSPFFTDTVMFSLNNASYVGGSGNRLAVETGAGSRISSVDVFPKYDGTSFGYSATGATSGVSIYAGGVALASAGANSSWAASQSRTLYIGSNAFAEETWYPHGVLDYVYIFNRVLAPAEFAAINADPYQFLIPAA